MELTDTAVRWRRGTRYWRGRCADCGEDGVGRGRGILVDGNDDNMLHDIPCDVM